MRIRKRKVPLPITSLCPIPVSETDLHLSVSPVVQLSNPSEDLDDTDAYYNPPPSDQPIAGETKGDDASDAAKTHNNDNDKISLKGEEKKGKEEEDEKTSNYDTRKVRSTGAETNYTAFNLQNSSSPSSNYSKQVGVSREGDKPFPMKKKGGSASEGSSTGMIKDKKSKTSRTSKKLEHDQDEDDKEIKDNFDGGTGSTSSSTKKKVRGNTLMEGSRCSRVNGRGWRCCQQTLVGYSLCEHHLGKGRLRSMNSVRSRSSMGSSSKADQAKDSRPQPTDDKEVKAELPDRNNDITEEDEEKKALTMSKKKTKLGVVKARSMSSLLNQPNDTIAVATTEDNS